MKKKLYRNLFYINKIFINSLEEIEIKKEKFIDYNAEIYNTGVILIKIKYSEKIKEFPSRNCVSTGIKYKAHSIEEVWFYLPPKSKNMNIEEYIESMTHSGYEHHNFSPKAVYE